MNTALTAVWLSLGLSMQPASPPSQTPTAELPTCVPIAQRVREVGCWIIVDAPVGRVSPDPVFWHLDTFPTRAAQLKPHGCPAQPSLKRSGRSG